MGPEAVSYIPVLFRAQDRLEENWELLMDEHRAACGRAELAEAWSGVRCDC